MMTETEENISTLYERLREVTKRIEKLEKEVRESAGEKFNYTIFQNPAPINSGYTAPPINYISCGRCGLFYAVGSLHVCNAAPTYPTYSDTPNITYIQPAQNTQAVSHS